MIAIHDDRVLGFGNHFVIVQNLHDDKGLGSSVAVSARAPHQIHAETRSPPVLILG
jgi:hypothetical protein